jgi:NADPH2:quinone reductase
MTTEAFVLTKYGNAEDALQLKTVDLPALKSNEVLIDSEGFGLNYADVMARRNMYKEAPALPAVLGYEVVGKVIQIGSECDTTLLGKRVLAFTRFGAYAKHVVTIVTGVLEIGDLESHIALALCTQGVTAYYMASYISQIRPMDKVLVHAAAGGVGSLLVQMAKNNGAIVIAKVGTAEKVDVVLDLGADFTINYKTENYEERLLSILRGDCLDISFNAVAGSTVKKDLSLLGPGGRLFLFGGAEMVSGKFGIFSKLNFVRKMMMFLPIGLMMRSKSIIGVNMLKIADVKPEIIATCLKEVYQLYLQGKLHPLLGKQFKQDSMQEAHAFLESGTSQGKVSVIWD